MPDKSGKLRTLPSASIRWRIMRAATARWADTIGRFANRIGGGCFTLDGTKYHLYQNDGENTLHGGKTGFQKKVWQATPVAGDTVDSVKFH